MSEIPIPEAPRERLATNRVPSLANVVVGVFVGCAFADALSGGILSAFAMLLPGGADFLTRPLLADFVHGSPLDLLVSASGWACLLLAGLTHGDVFDLLQNVFLALGTLPILEQVFGRARTVLVLVVSTLTASAFSMALFPADAAKCASGAMFGAVGLLLGVLTMRRELLPAHLETRLALVIGLGVAGESVIATYSPFVNHGMHLGGFLAGLLLSCVLEPRAANGAKPRRLGLGVAHGIMLALALVAALVAGVERSRDTLPHALLEAGEDFELGRLEPAIRRMEAVVARPPRGSAEQLLHPVAQNELAWFYVKARRELEKAIELSEASNRTLDSRPEFLDTLGYLYALSGDCRKAADAMGRAAALDPAYTRRRDEVNRACEQGRPPDPDLPVEKPIEGLPTGPGIPV